MMSFILIVVFPVVTMAVMKGLDLIDSWQLPEREQRIGPLIAISVFYIWYFVNVKNGDTYPDYVRAIALGGAICISLCFFINNFTKISLHTAGAGAFVAGLIGLFMEVGTANILISGPNNHEIRLSAIFVLFLAVLIAGMIGSARLRLGAHRMEDITAGYAIGALALFASFQIMT